MAVFPNPSVELQLDGTWTDITADAFVRDSITINRGRANEGAQVDPSQCNLTLDNRTGKYSPRNPVGVHFGVLGRNTPLRVLIPAGLANHLLLPGNPASHVSTPDAAALDIVGDIDIRIDLEPSTWRPDSTRGMARKYQTLNNQRSWAFYLLTTGNLVFAWSPDGTVASLRNSTSTVAVPSTPGRLFLRVTMDVDNGAAGHDVKFWTAPGGGGPWTQLGATVTTAGATSIHAGTAPLEVGRMSGPPPLGGITSDATQGKVYVFQLHGNIDGGPAVALPRFSDQDSGDTSFSDFFGLVWTLQGNAVMANPNARFHGAVSAWPPRWEQSGNDVWTPVQADGIMRRLGQGAAPLRSSMRRAMEDVDVVAYWPCEDGEDATELASGLPGHPPMKIPGGNVELSSFGDFKASLPLPVAGTSQWTGTVPAYPLPNPRTVQVRFLMHIPAGGVSANAIVCSLRTSGLSARWDLIVNSAGSLAMQVFDNEDVLLYLGLFSAHNVNGKLMRVSMEMENTPTGGDCTFKIVTLEVGSLTGLFNEDTVQNHGVGGAVTVAMNVAGAGGNLSGVALGHISVHDEITSIFDLGSESAAWTGELATDRILRLCADQSIPVSLTGERTDSTALGPQLPRTLLELLQEAADADLGILYEPRGFLGLAYRTRASLYAQDAALALDYAAGDLSGIEPVEDDQATRNDVTVKRDGGSSTRRELTTGALSTADPPNGIGRYDEEVTVSVELDTDVGDQAGWRLHLGTVDEARYPVLGVNLATPSFTGSAVKTAAAQALDVGDRLTVTNPPAWLPPDLIAQIAQGFTETISPPSGVPYRHPWVIDVNCSPASPWDAVGRWDDATDPGEARYSSDGSTLAASLTSTATSMSVATPTGPLWSAADQPFDLYVGGERMTVTAVTGAASPQTFTVTRSVNGVVKAHPAASEVRLFKPAVYAL